MNLFVSGRNEYKPALRREQFASLFPLCSRLHSNASHFSTFLYTRMRPHTAAPAHHFFRPLPHVFPHPCSSVSSLLSSETVKKGTSLYLAKPKFRRRETPYLQLTGHRVCTRREILGASIALLDSRTHMHATTHTCVVCETRRARTHARQNARKSQFRRSRRTTAQRARLFEKSCAHVRFMERVPEFMIVKAQLRASVLSRSQKHARSMKSRRKIFIHIFAYILRQKTKKIHGDRSKVALRVKNWDFLRQSTEQHPKSAMYVKVLKRNKKILLLI